MADPKRERRDAAIAARTAAKWRRVRFRDNREPSTRERPLMLGTPDDVRCWCGGPLDHPWPGKDDSAPHPREIPKDSTMQVIINPGSGPVPDAAEEHAMANMAVFVLDLGTKGLPVANAVRRPEADYGDGRYAFTLAMADGRTIEIQMPGLPVDQVRYVDSEDQNIWDFPRLYVDGSSWVWKFALSVCEPDDEENA